ncbi:MAG: hypothetical protein DRP62_03550 [Planctomycetota bacterium]|nr:MAG: hypothetical protein DRP62_03550 [Planctomycetota bacterium]
MRLLKKNDKANKMFNEMKNIKSLWEKFGLCARRAGNPAISWLYQQRTILRRSPLMHIWN